MELVELSDLIAYIVALSIAAERLVEIIKGIVPFFRTKAETEEVETWRRVALQLLAVGAGMLTAHLAMPAVEDLVPPQWQSFPGIVALGLLASGGSSLWNSVLDYASSVTSITKLNAELKKLKKKKG
jgi:drug/metabolite transporter (DMT)-like permease